MKVVTGTGGESEHYSFGVEEGAGREREKVFMRGAMWNDDK